MSEFPPLDKMDDEQKQCFEAALRANANTLAAGMLSLAFRINVEEEVLMPERCSPFSPRFILKASRSSEALGNLVTEVPTGVCIELPPGFTAYVSNNPNPQWDTHDFCVLPFTFDASFREQIRIPVFSPTQTRFPIPQFTEVAVLSISTSPGVSFVPTDEGFQELKVEEVNDES